MSVSIKAALEAVLFATNHPLSLEEAAEALEASKDAVRKALDELGADYEVGERGVRLTQLAGGWQLATRPEMSDYVERMLVGRRRARLSRAGLETLAAVAYHQPITKGEVDTIRGVDCSGALRTLLDRDLVTVKGRSDKVGRPLLYATTPAFLEYFGLATLEDLPQLDDFAALVDREALQEELAITESTTESPEEESPPAEDDHVRDVDDSGEDTAGDYEDADDRNGPDIGFTADPWGETTGIGDGNGRRGHDSAVPEGPPPPAQ